MRLLLAVLLLAGCASAQVEPPISPAPSTALLDETSPASGGDRTEVEAAVAATIAEPGVHVVHFWAPWCGNSKAELENGLYEVVEGHPDVTFAFVTIWNDARDGADRLARYGIEAGANVSVYAQPDRGPSADRDLRRTTFLGLPLTWTPTTWIYNRSGKLAYAFNYGEVTPEQLAAAIADARNEWTHD